MGKELSTAIRAVTVAGAVSLEYFGGRIASRMKPDNTPVTKIDKLCEREILKIIRKNFPGDSILSEESPEIRKDSHRRWIIDPIDGTKAYLRGLPTYGNMVAFEENGDLLAAAINIPAMKHLLFAEKGKGAYDNGRRICVSSESNLSKTYILHGRGKGFLEKGYLKKLRKLLDAVYHSWGMSEPYAPYLVATGRVDAFVETFPHPWDIAAPKLIVEEAGGIVTDLAGRETLTSKTIAIYSNGKIHDYLIRILKK